MLITTVTGLFTKFRGTVETSDSEAFENGYADVSIETVSVYTNETYRDDHLRSPEFFDVETFPYINFSSTAIKKTENKNEYVILGNLNIKNITKEIRLLATFGGAIRNEGQIKAGFELTGSIKRKDFNLTYNPLMEAGGMVVSENVDILANIELTKV